MLRRNARSAPRAASSCAAIELSAFATSASSSSARGSRVTRALRSPLARERAVDSTAASGWLSRRASASESRTHASSAPDAARRNAGTARRGRSVCTGSVRMRTGSSVRPAMDARGSARNARPPRRPVTVAPPRRSAGSRSVAATPAGNVKRSESAVPAPASTVPTRPRSATGTTAPWVSRNTSRVSERRSAPRMLVSARRAWARRVAGGALAACVSAVVSSVTSFCTVGAFARRSLTAARCDVPCTRTYVTPPAIERTTTAMSRRLPSNRVRSVGRRRFTARPAGRAGSRRRAPS